MRRIPVFATLVVTAAVATMIALGVWQLQRLDQKEALIARYELAARDSVPLLDGPQDIDGIPDVSYFRQTTYVCDRITGWRAVAGRNSAGRSGIAHWASCVSRDQGGDEIDVVVGWSTNPKQPVWNGGRVTGIVAPGDEHEFRIVADPPLAGLEPNALPDPRDIPNNHFAYAIQWFLFAGVAAVIYGIALRKRMRGK